MNINFKSSFIKSVGDGSTTSFWDEVWIGGEKLRLLFPRLYRFEVTKDAMICDRVDTSTDVTRFKWEWSRSPSGRTAGELDDMSVLISNFKFSGTSKDVWNWSLAHVGKLTVKGLSNLIEENLNPVNNSTCETMRNKLVPKKLEVFVWRALQNRIHARLELYKRGIDLHSVRCPLCDDDLESVSHSLIFCKDAMEIWDRVFAWWGLGNMSNLSLNEICRGKCSVPVSCFGKMVWQAVEWVCSYLIWKNRNSIAFRGKKWNTPVALNEIQVKSFEWISTRSSGRRFDWFTWLNDPSVYLRLA
ncbi:uncharacterized protein [Rutidosis leptorrhynchoides]|uniref:uncharacterized protein n=1 Tax=Rutidosis leptorrhynchoides TaxID=125765 RepID=UPI003A9A254E